MKAYVVYKTNDTFPPDPAQVLECVTLQNSGTGAYCVNPFKDSKSTFRLQEDMGQDKRMRLEESFEMCFSFTKQENENDKHSKAQEST